MTGKELWHYELWIMEVMDPVNTSSSTFISRNNTLSLSTAFSKATICNTPVPLSSLATAMATAQLLPGQHIQEFILPISS